MKYGRILAIELAFYCCSENE